MNDVYQPSEDTFLLMDVIKEVPYVRRALEVGSGSGAVSVNLAHKTDYLIATDIDLNSCHATLERLRKHNLRANTDVVCCDLLSAFRESSSFDLIVFNPPYLPDECLKDVSIFGGKHGVETSAEFLQQAHHALSHSGSILLVVSSISDLGKLWAVASKLKLNHKILKSVKLFFEEISVVEFKKGV
ncbi:MAG: methyltransferase [Thaumarchaeota archaeon]|jgi:release factor glutamine methyltransferase|nr:methyltransferase [Candidatus Terraquivivens yellowstonensis]